MPMTDSEFAKFCGFRPTDNQDAVAKYIRELTPEKRAMIDKMQQIEMWDATDGLVPLPADVIVCRPKQCREGKRR